MITVRRLAFIPPVLLGVALLWWATANRPPPGTVAAAERPVPVAYVAALPRAFTPEVSGFGEVAPARVWTAVAQVAGRIAYVHEDFIRGGAVGEGEVLLEIARDTYELAVARAEADIRSAEAKVAEIRLSKTTTEASLEIERQALALAEGDLARVAKLNQTGATSNTAVENKEREVLAQRVKVQSHMGTLAVLPAQLEAAEQSVAVARTSKQSAELDLTRTVVTAPFDGRVASADVEISQFVGVGTPMGSIDGAAAAEIDVQMPPRLMASLARLAFLGNGGETPADISRLIRARVSLDVDGANPVWPAEVARISEVVDPATRSIGVIVRVTDPYGAARPGERPPLIKGMFVKVTLSGPALDKVILVPRRAIREGRVMLAGPDDRLTYASITPIFSADGIAVLSADALPEGSRIIVTEPSPAVEGLLLAPQRDEVAEARLDAATGASR